MMQQDVAGSLRVSLKSSLSILSPMSGGFQGVDGSPRNWIPASAGMTEESVRLRRTGVWGVPRFSTLPPRVGDQGG
jgi:hypothetical protein